MTLLDYPVPLCIATWPLRITVLVVIILLSVVLGICRTPVWSYHKYIHIHSEVYISTVLCGYEEGVGLGKGYYWSLAVYVFNYSLMLKSSVLSIKLIIIGPFQFNSLLPILLSDTFIYGTSIARLLFT